MRRTRFAVALGSVAAAVAVAAACSKCREPSADSQSYMAPSAPPGQKPPAFLPPVGKVFGSVSRVPTARWMGASDWGDALGGGERDGTDEQLRLEQMRFLSETRLTGYAETRHRFESAELGPDKVLRRIAVHAVKFDDCAPIHPTLAIYACIDAKPRFIAMVSVDRAGKPHEEARFDYLWGSSLAEDLAKGYAKPDIRDLMQRSVSGDGGMALLGCGPQNDGSKKTIVEHCVRQPNGEWKHVRFDASELYDLGDEARPTFLPRADGRLFVVLTTVKSHRMVWEIRNERLEPLWRSAPRDDQLMVDRNGARATWLSDRTVQLMVFGTPPGKQGETKGRCNWTIDFSSTAVRGDCAVERMSFPPPMGLGRFDIRATDNGAYFETVDGGRSWSPLGKALGLSQCHAIGCEAGDRFRFGWGAR